MDNKEFWSNRVIKYGHTGWANAAIYAFDQEVRINIVKRLVLQNSCHDKILDFGGGTGDFLAELNGIYDKGVLYDPCEPVLELARKRLPSNVKCYSNIETIKQKEVQKYDILLSITVLQHIMTDEELGEILTFLCESLSEEGKFIVMESFDKNAQSEYKRAWSYDEFIRIIEKHGLEVIEAYDYYNPSNGENKKFRNYISRIDVKLLLWLHSRIKINIDKRLKRIASKYNKNIDDFYSEFSNTSGSKFIILKRKCNIEN